MPPELSFSSAYRSVQAGLFLQFRGTGIDPVAARLRTDNGIIIKNPSAWGGHSPEEVSSFMGSVSSLNFARDRKLIIAKDLEVPLNEVAAAVAYAKEIAEIDPAMFPLSLRISTDLGVDKMTMKKGQLTLSRRFLQRRIEPGNRVFEAFVDPAKLEALHMDIRRAEIEPSDIADIGGFSDEMNRRLRDITFGALSTRPRAPVSRELTNWAMHIAAMRVSSIRQARQFKERFLGHTLNVLAAYNQVPEIYFDPVLFPRTDKKGLERMFRIGVPGKTVAGNLADVKGLYQTVPQDIMFPTIVLHDIGKLRDETFHHEESVKMMDEMRLLDFWDLSEVEKLIVRSVIKYHVIPGGISLGEFSFLIFEKVIIDPDVRQIISAKQFPLFADALTLFTICDIAGYDRFIPLNRRIENYMRVNGAMKSYVMNLNIADPADTIMSADGIGRTDTLLTSSFEAVNKRIAGFLSMEDANLDANEAILGDYFYTSKVLAKVKKLGVPKKNWESVIMFLTLLRSFTYGGRFLNFIFWKDPKERRAVTDKTEVNEKAIIFLLELAHSVNLNKRLPIDALLIRKKDGKPIGRDEYDEYLEYFIRQINEMHMPDIAVNYTEDHIELKIIMPDPR